MQYRDAPNESEHENKVGADSRAILMSLHRDYPTLLCEFEIHMSGPIDAACELVHDYRFKEGIPDGMIVKKRVTIADYIEQLTRISG